jgi:hypothetical protein
MTDSNGPAEMEFSPSRSEDGLPWTSGEKPMEKAMENYTKIQLIIFCVRKCP